MNQTIAVVLSIDYPNETEQPDYFLCKSCAF